MGFNSEVFIFDYDVYRNDVIPFFYDLLRTSVVPEWLQIILDKTHRRFEIEDLPATNLEQYCTWLEACLAWTGSYENINMVEAGWDERVCRSTDCPEINHCPFHQGRTGAPAENLLRLLEITVSLRCLGPSQFVGRSRVPDRFRDSLSEMNASCDLESLLSKLGKRGFVIGYRWGGGEGIQGWLTPSETTELAWHLEHLPLPKYEASFEAMERFYKWQQYGSFNLGGYECDGYSFEALSLSFVRTVATMASQKGKGVLWGNDVMDADFYLNYEKYL